MAENLKRPRDLPSTDDTVSDEATKRAKLETEQLEADMVAAIKKEEDDLPKPPAPGDKDGDLPVTIMYKTFVNGSDCRDYYSRILNQLRLNQDLNEYEHNMVLGLVRKGHPDPTRKIGQGIKAIQIREEMFDANTSRVFTLLYTNGSDDNFSVKKCISSLFPKTAPIVPTNRPAGPRMRGAGVGRRGGPGRGGPGRGGPGRGRGRFPMRGGRGRGPRMRGGHRDRV